MAFKSIAQRDRALRQLKAGEISQETFDSWDKDTPADIPERLHKPKHPADGPEVDEPQKPEPWSPEF